MKSTLFQEALSELANEMSLLLKKKGETKLAEQIPSLQIVDRCRCEDDFCATIYTAPKPKGAWGPSHESIPLDPAQGYLILDVVDKKIVCIEVLYREDIRKKVLHLFP